MASSRRTFETYEACCPYYRCHADKRIVCRSEVMDADSNTINFRNNDRRDLQLQTFCFSTKLCRMCPHMVAIEHFDWKDDD